MTLDTKRVISDYLRHELLQDRPDFVVADDTNLLTEHVIDSLGIFMLISFLEEKYGIVVDADEVLVENFETLADITRLVEDKLEPASSRSVALS